MTRLVTPTSKHFHPKNFGSAFNLCEFASKSKNQSITLACSSSGGMVDLKILYSDWLRTFWHVSLKQKFYQI